MKIGVDEAGRGALAGPVVVAAVCLGVDVPPGLRDSKRLTPGRRQQLAERLRASALAWEVVAVPAAEIDRINILQATLAGMVAAVAAVARGRIGFEVLVDGNQLPRWRWPSRAIVGGDDIEPAIMAASILAKVHRDALMVAADGELPGYGFAVHKGYPTADHRAALQRLGPSPWHRRSFGPVARLVAESAQGRGGGAAAPKPAAGQEPPCRGQERPNG